MRGDEFNYLYGDMFSKNKKNPKNKNNNNKEAEKKQIDKDKNIDIDEKNNDIKGDKDEKKHIEKKKGEVSEDLQMEINTDKKLEDKKLEEKNLEKERRKNNAKYKSNVSILKKNQKMMKLLNIELSEEMKNHLLIEIEKEKNDKNKNLKMNLPQKLRNDENLIYLFRKTNKYIEIRKFIIKNFNEKREEDINFLDDKISLLKMKMTEKDKDKEDNFEEFKKDFPDLNLDFILGLTKKEKAKKINEIKKQIKNEVKNLNVDKEKFAYHDLYYTNFLEKLKKIEENENIPLPEFKKKKIKVDYNEIYKTIQRGELFIKIKKFHIFKKSRFYFLKFHIDYNTKKFEFKTPYSKEGGKITFEKKLKLVANNLKDQIKKSKVIFELHKKTVMMFQRFVDKKEVNLEKILLTPNFQLDFAYKNEKKMKVDINFEIDIPLTDDNFIFLDLFCFDGGHQSFEFLDDEALLVGDEEEKEKFVFGIEDIVDRNKDHVQGIEDFVEKNQDFGQGKAKEEKMGNRGGIGFEDGKEVGKD